jgi:hypothetical protein
VTLSWRLDLVGRYDGGMVGKRQFSMRYLLGLVAAFAASLGLMKFLLSTLHIDEDELTLSFPVCFLFLEVTITVSIWGLFFGDLLGLTGADSRWQNLRAALIALIVLGVTYSLFLPA